MFHGEKGWNDGLDNKLFRYVMIGCDGDSPLDGGVDGRV